jgi:ureidoglycolate lyase
VSVEAFHAAPSAVEVPVDVESSVQVTTEPLTAEAFAPFGEVIEHRDAGRRHYLPVQFGDDPALKETMWVTRLAEGTTSPARFPSLEHHPFSDQAFVPLRGQPFLAITCPTTAEGAPDLEAVRVFRAEAHQGIIWRRGVWHGGLTVLAGPAEFVVIMGTQGAGDDIVFQLPVPIDVNFEVVTNA